LSNRVTHSTNTSLQPLLNLHLLSLLRIHSAIVRETQHTKHNMSTEPQLDAASIARLSLHEPINFPVQHSQTLHRLELLQHWNISTGSKVLELGCGQGDSTTVLASAVGEQGTVVAIDPASLDYGEFFSLSSQAESS
jgi:predicted methyltransferase